MKFIAYGTPQYPDQKQKQIIPFKANNLSEARHKVINACDMSYKWDIKENKVNLFSS